MKKHIALGIAAVVLGASGVASAIVSVNQITALGASESGVSVNHDQLAADCWMITGSASDAGCNTSVAGIPVPGLPEIPNLVDGVDLPDTAGILSLATGALDNPTGALSTVTGLVPGGVPGAGDVAGAVPRACGVNLPVGLPSGIFSAGLNLFHMAQSLAMNDLGLAEVSSPVDVPVGLPLSADDVINKLETEVGCLAGQDGGLPVPAVCSIQGGIPAAVTSAVPGGVTDALPADITGLLTAAVGDLASLSGQGVTLAEGGNVGVSCNVDGVLAEMPIPGLEGLPGLPGLPSPTALLPVVPSAPALPALPAAPLPAVPDVTGTVTDVVDTVTGVVNGLLSGGLPLDVAPLPSTPDCSASASTRISGLLGSLTSTITGGCR